jgi:hypothetical protein
MMRRKSKMPGHRLDCVMSRPGVHRPLLARIGIILDPRRFDQPKWHGGLAPSRPVVEVTSPRLFPAGARHNIKNTGEKSLKLYTLYAPPEHVDGTVHATKADAETSEEHFDGKTTE